jgi:hypothetical protein
MAKHSSQGIIKDDQAQEQPADKERARTVQRSDPKKSATHEATRDPRLNEAEKRRKAEVRQKDSKWRR